jgi:hypothetical protein
LLPHLSQRAEIYQFPDIGDAEYIVLDTAASTVPLVRQEYEGKVDALLQDERYGVVLSKTSLIVLQQGASREKNAQVLKQLWE